MSSNLDPSKVYLIRGDTLNRLHAKDDALWGGDNIQRGPGIYRRGAGNAGFSLASKPGVPSPPPNGGPAATPFQISIRASPASPPGTLPNQASVYWNSSLLKNQVLNNVQTITGLADAPSPTGDGNPNWFTFINGNDLIWLEINIIASTATINSYGLGGSWAPSDLPGEYGSGSGPFEYQISYDANGNSIYTQYIARIAIFESTTSASPPFSVTNFQLLNQNLILEGDVYSGALKTTADGPATIGITMPKLFSGSFIAT